MKIKNYKYPFVLALFLVLLGALSPKISFSDGFIDPAEIHEGMVGYGKTVFHGTKIETFKVTVLGVLKKAVADTDLILVKIDSPYLKQNKIGLVAGMSGSPVYFNGKLAGAVAYGWPFTETPLAGITPIRAMLDSNPKNKSRVEASTLPLKNLPESMKRYLPSESAKDSLALSPLGIPVSASGFDAEGLARLKTFLPMLNVVPGGGKIQNTEPYSMEPGQSVGAALVDGDINLVATGTLTYRDGSNILAFGHPFLSLGDVDIPLFVNYVHSILPSMQLPFKFASPMKEVGTVLQDRLYGIGGSLAQHASMVPMDIVLSDPERGIVHPFHVRLARHPQFTAHLAGLVLEQAVSSMTKALGDSTVKVDFSFYFKGLPPLHLHNMLFSDQSISGVVTGEMLKSLSKVLDNDFERTSLEKITVNASISSEVSAATLQKMVLSKHHLDPGEPLGITIFLKPYNQAVIKKSYTLHLPSDIQGTVDVGSAGGVSDDQLRRTIQQQLPDPLNVQQILEGLQQATPNNSLVIRLGFPRHGVHWAGENFGNLPTAYTDLLKAAGSSPLSLSTDGEEYRYEMPWAVIGTETQEITVGTKETLPFISQTHHTPSELPATPHLEELPSTTTSHGMETSLFSLPLLSDDASDKKTTATESETTDLQSFGTLKDWQEGTLHHLAISSRGNLFLAPKTIPEASFEENVLWSIASEKNSLYVGTANPGKIYKIVNHSKTLFFDPHAVAVLSLAVLPNGDVLAGTTGGKLMHLSSEGKVKDEWQIAEHYIWQILVEKQSVYLATGNPEGKIYRLDFSIAHPEPHLVYASSQSHILSLCVIGKDIFAGTANDGLLLDIGPDGQAKTLHTFDNAIIPALAKGQDGSLLIGTGADKGKVYLRNASGEMEQIAELPDASITWLGTSGEKILAATGIPARLYELQEGKEPGLLWDGKPDERVGLKGTENADYFFTSGNDPSLFALSTTPVDHGDFLSKVIDAQHAAIWGHTVWHGDIPPGAQIQVESRSGNSAEPDATWSGWSTPYPPERQPTQSASSRYLQYRVMLSRPESATSSPRLETLQVVWRVHNLPPSIQVVDPNPGDVVGPEKPLHVKVSDKDGDTLRVTALREHNHQSEQFFEKLVPLSKDKGEDDIEIPLNKLHDQGPMDVHFIVSDNPSYAADQAFKAEIFLKNLTFDSIPPTLKLTRVEKDSHHLSVKGEVRDKESYVKSVQFKLDDGEWLDTVPEKGMFDWPENGFSFEVNDLTDVKEIQIRVKDAADNESILKKDLDKLAVGDEAVKAPKEEKKKKSDKSSSKDQSSLDELKSLLNK